VLISGDLCSSFDRQHGKQSQQLFFFLALSSSEPIVDKVVESDESMEDSSIGVDVRIVTGSVVFKIFPFVTNLGGRGRMIVGRINLRTSGGRAIYNIQKVVIFLLDELLLIYS
jgi:hypothetical protein